MSQIDQKSRTYRTKISTINDHNMHHVFPRDYYKITFKVKLVSSMAVQDLKDLGVLLNINLLMNTLNANDALFILNTIIRTMQHQ